MDKGFYLYCVRSKNDRKFSAKGIGGGKISVIPYQNLETIVSEVSLTEFGSKGIQKKAKEDLGWIKEKAQIHEQVIEEAMKKGGEIIPVIPMKFGTIFKTKENLLKTFEKHYSNFKKTLEDLTGKQEWAVKVYVIDKEKFAEEIKRKDEEVKKLKEGAASEPEGVKYFLEKRIDEEVSKKISEKLDIYIKDIFQIFYHFSVKEPVINKLLPEELTGKGREMISNVSYLVQKERLDEFQKTVKRLHDYYSSKGLWIEYTGPWPPYNFI